MKKAVMAMALLGLVGASAMVVSAEPVREAVTALTYVGDDGLILTDIVYTFSEEMTQESVPEDLTLIYTFAPNPYMGIEEAYDEVGRILEIKAEGNQVDLVVEPTAYNKQDIQVCSENPLFATKMEDFTRKTQYVDDFVKDTFTSSEGTQITYFLYLPEEEKAPLMVWEHGGGEVLSSSYEGANLVANRGAVAWIEAGKGSAVLSVQYPENYSFGITEVPEEFEKMTAFNVAKAELIGKLIEEGKVDASRVYISGASSGGGGALRFMMQYPNLFAGGLVICAKDTVVPLSQKYDLAYQLDDPKKLRISDEDYAAELSNVSEVIEESLASVPIWFAQAENDPVCTSYTSKLVYEVLEGLGAKDNHLTLYTDEEMQAAGQSFFHSSWVPALRDSEIIDWLYGLSK